MFTRAWRSMVLVTGEAFLLIASVIISSVVVAGPYAWDLLTDSTAVFRVLLIVMV